MIFGYIPRLGMKVISLRTLRSLRLRILPQRTQRKMSGYCRAKVYDDVRSMTQDQESVAWKLQFSCPEWGKMSLTAGVNRRKTASIQPQSPNGA